MKSIISLMSEIEKEAADIVDTAIAKKSDLYKSLEEKMISIDKNYDSKMNQEIENLNNKCTSAYNREMDKAKESTDKKIKDLEEMYKTKYENYLDSIYKRIIGM